MNGKRGILFNLLVTLLLILILLSFLFPILRVGASQLSSLKSDDVAGLERLLSQVPATDATQIRRMLYSTSGMYRDLFLRNAGQITVRTTDGAQCYDAETKTIYIDFTKAGTDARGPYTAFFHECAHAIDDLEGGILSGSLSLSGSLWGDTLGSALQKDYLKLTDHITDESRFCETLTGPGQECVSDILGGLSANRLRGKRKSGDRILYGYGHDTAYWEIEGNLEKEFFAEYLSYQLSGNKEALRRISSTNEGMFPLAAAWVDGKAAMIVRSVNP